MSDLNGLYLELPSCGHTYGISAINNTIIYDKLHAWFFRNWKTLRIFLQSDSDVNNYGRPEDKSYLFIEFLGMNLDDDRALMVSELIANELKEELKIL